MVNTLEKMSITVEEKELAKMDKMADKNKKISKYVNIIKLVFPSLKILCFEQRNPNKTYVSEKTLYPMESTAKLSRSMLRKWRESPPATASTPRLRKFPRWTKLPQPSRYKFCYLSSWEYSPLQAIDSDHSGWIDKEEFLKFTRWGTYCSGCFHVLQSIAAAGCYSCARQDLM